MEDIYQTSSSVGSPTTPRVLIPVYQSISDNCKTPGSPLKVGVSIRKPGKPFREDLSLTQKAVESATKVLNEAKKVHSEATKKHQDALKRSDIARKLVRAASEKLDKAESAGRLDTMSDKARAKAVAKVVEAENMFTEANSKAISAVEEVSVTREEMLRSQNAVLTASHTLSRIKSKERENWIMQNDRSQDTGVPGMELSDLSAMYSTYMSYCKDIDLGSPVMPWKLSHRQLLRLRKLYVIACDLTKKEAMSKLKDLLSLSVKRMRENGNFWFHIPKRDKDHLEYCHSLEFPLLRRDKLVKRSFVDGRTRHTACMMVWLLFHLFKNLESNKVETAREIFYRGKQIFQKYRNAKVCIVEVCCILECTSASLNVLPEEKGVVIGSLILEMADGKKVDCSDHQPLPRHLRDISKITIGADVQFILVVEKGTIYNYLRRAKFHQKNHCLLLTAYGMPDERMRAFLRLLQRNASVPILGIADPDAYGVLIMKTFAKGSISLAHANFSLATVSIHWLGISTLDIEEIERFKSKRILSRCPKLNAPERTLLKNLQSPQYMLSAVWNQRILHMLNINRKACFEDLHVFGETYVANVHIPFLVKRVMDNLGKVNGNGFGTKLSFDDIKLKTDNFGTKSLMGEGSYGELFSVVLDQGEHLALRKLKVPVDPQSKKKFQVQVATASKIKHENLLEFYGFCTEEDKYFLAYEFASLGSLHDIMHGEKQANPLAWSERIKIAIDIAKGLEYLHDKAHPLIVHGDIRPSNILIFENHKAKIAEFNIAKLSLDFYSAARLPPDESPDYSLARISYGVEPKYIDAIKKYRAPECRSHEPTNIKSDVYSFGLVLSELITGKKFSVDVLPWSHLLSDLKDPHKDAQKKESKDLLKQYLDPILRDRCPSHDLDKFAEVIVDCLQPSTRFRPRISEVVKDLSLLLDQE